jgi:hypothetical protein
VTARPVRTDPDAGLPDLVQQLTADSKRLVKDEILLAKLETREAIHTAARGGLRMAVAFGVGIVAMIAFTIALATGIGRLANDNMWIGAMAAGALELAIGSWLIRRGVGRFTEPSYSMEETRAALKETMTPPRRARLRY